ncbi:winged helix-turn-helix transcriptional regulator [Streptomyces sp. NPDC002870]|uniref:winged helix-turn-helix transcriptional regulator n=1 Tax=Streptomyces sp. NPDC002870 TaxID=3364666 RepID=UPI0036A1718B
MEDARVITAGGLRASPMGRGVRGVRRALDTADSAEPGAGCETFSDILRGAPGMSRTLLAARLRELQRHGLLSRDQGPGHSVRYRLTEAGTDLWQVCLALGAWGVRWLELAPEHLDPYPVLWAMCRSADPAALPDHRVVVRLDFPVLRPPNRFWLLYEHGGAEVCVHSPGGDEDLSWSPTRQRSPDGTWAGRPGPRRCGPATSL